jgi:hypothetical protein
VISRPDAVRSAVLLLLGLNETTMMGVMGCDLG